MGLRAHKGCGFAVSVHVSQGKARSLWQQVLPVIVGGVKPKKSCDALTQLS